MNRDNDAGQAAVQFAGVFPILLLVCLLCFKIYASIVTVERVDNAARTGAREASKVHNAAVCSTKAMAALPSWLTEPQGDDPGPRASANGAGGLDGVSCHVRAKIPVLWQAVPLNFTVDRTVHMPG